jgi:hypothetical protein
MVTGGRPPPPTGYDRTHPYFFFFFVAFFFAIRGLTSSRSGIHYSTAERGAQ